MFSDYWHERADERLGDPPQRWIQEPLVVRDGDGRPPRGPLAVDCFSV